MEKGFITSGPVLCVLSSFTIVSLEKAFPHGAVGLSAVCICDISWSKTSKQ